MRLLLLVAAGLSAMSLPSHAEFVDGSKLHEWLLASKRADSKGADHRDYSDASLLYGYLEGVTDVALDGKLLCPLPGGMKVVQVEAVVYKWMNDHPELWHHDGASIVVAAMKSSFCKKDDQ